MAKKMLIDATHPEETRVVVADGNKLEEFDFEAANRRQLIGNIYLAKVTRVEPSLQAAFVEYGGNRHGFLAFSEIHPDYYQIPVADRQALLEQQAAAEREAADRDADNGDNGDDDHDQSVASEPSDEPEAAATAEDDDADHDDAEDEDIAQAEPVSLGTVEPLEEISRPRPYRRSYKIQEVIKKRQILLVQVMKDERGTKGAALTTYLSLPGRYCVLMPNTARGGGISRKITKAVDRKKLKSIANELEVPEGMGLIIRTAGANRTKAEVKRDFESLLRLWEDVRDRTLKSSAPTLIYEEGNLIKRAIRDLYAKDIDSIIVEGEDGYREAKSFMRMLMPSHAKNVQLYKERPPLFQRHGVENQIYSMFNPVVQLPSGGYIVFDPTEALVAIDVNSGKATREHNIEETATTTNLEAAEEVARQLRLRDLAGLIVIDFIDMEENRNIRAVERRLKDCLKSDRARIQVGRISAFGLMEMSRQRLRTGVVETTTQPCPHCHGTGLIRSVESTALHILRSVEEECLKRRAAEITVTAPTTVALYILNHKRAWLSAIEAEYGVGVLVVADAAFVVPDYRMERTRAREVGSDEDERKTKPAEPAVVELVEAEIADEDAEDEAAAAEEATSDDDEDGGKRRRRRRRRRRKRRGDEAHEQDDTSSAAAEADDDVEPAQADAVAEVDEAAVEEVPETVDDVIAAAGPLFEDPEAPAAQTEKPKRSRRRGGEGRTRTRKPRAAAATGDDVAPEAPSTDVEGPVTVEMVVPPVPSEAPAPAVASDEPDAGQQEADPHEYAAEPPAPPAPLKPEPVWPDPVPATEPVAAEPEPEPERAQRRGWWQRRLSR
jgi:ribonuclease E